MVVHFYFCLAFNGKLFDLLGKNERTVLFQIIVPIVFVKTIKYISIYYNIRTIHIRAFGLVV
jgi:hypothetical protein